MLRKLMFVSRPVAEKMPGWSEGAIISITEPDVTEADLMQGWYAIHRAVFHDAEPQKVIRDPLIVMTAKHAEDIIDFVHEVAPNVKTIVIHCKGGISRSAAVAKWIAEAYGLPFNESYTLYNKHVYRQLVNASQKREEQDA